MIQHSQFWWTSISLPYRPRTRFRPPSHYHINLEQDVMCILQSVTEQICWNTKQLFTNMFLTSQWKSTHTVTHNPPWSFTKTPLSIHPTSPPQEKNCQPLKPSSPIRGLRRSYYSLILMQYSHIGSMPLGDCISIKHDTINNPGLFITSNRDNGPRQPSSFTLSFITWL